MDCIFFIISDFGVFHYLSLNVLDVDFYSVLLFTLQTLSTCYVPGSGTEKGKGSDLNS